MHELWHACALVLSRNWIRHVTRLNANVPVSYPLIASSVLIPWIESRHTYAWVMAHMCMSPVTQLDQACHTFKCKCASIRSFDSFFSAHTWDWVTSHIRKSHGTHLHAPCHTRRRAMSHAMSARVPTAGPLIASSALIPGIESRLTCVYVMSHMLHVCTSHVTHVHESCHNVHESCRTCKWGRSHAWTSNATYMNGSCLTN